MSDEEKQYEALTEMFEDKIMEMVRRRVSLRIAKSPAINGGVQLNIYLFDKGTTANGPFTFGGEVVTISAGIQ